MFKLREIILNKKNNFIKKYTFFHFCFQNFSTNLYLLSILHFHDSAIEKHKLEKIEPILKYFNQQSKVIVEPEKNLSIDAQMIVYKGTTAPTSFRQYMPIKPTNRGFKVWTRCGVSAFVYEIILHHGTAKMVSSQSSLSDTSLNRVSRQTTATTTVLEDAKLIGARREALQKEFGSSGLVVLDLIQNVPVGSFIFINNYFSSTKLIQKLTQLGYRVTCTLRSNRLQNCPISTEKQFEKKKRGYYEYFISDINRCIVIAWNDSKRVLLGSNYIGVEPITTLQRWDKETRCNVDVKAPQIISQYKKHMEGVDTMDMLVALHPIPFRSKRWYFRIIWRILDIMIINSWIVMNSCRNGTNHRSFRLFHFKFEVARFLLQKPMLQVLQSVPVGVILDVSESDEENQLPIKEKCEAASNVSRLTRYDGFNH